MIAPTRRPRGLAAAASLLPAAMLLASSLAFAGVTANAVVPGMANPNLAYRFIGYECCNGDKLPEQAPTQVMGKVFAGCDELEFNVTGRVSYIGGPTTGNNPDGDEVFDMVTYGDGLSAPKKVKANSLVGVFLDETSPTGQTTPPSLDFSIGLGFFNLEPGLRQIFFIGDGLTSDSSAGLTGQSSAQIIGTNQRFRVPPGGKRVFLGTADGEGWFNNTGSFTVETVVYPYERLTACGDAAEPEGIFASDALRVLRGAVGSASCFECDCDVDHSGKVVATDALAVLRSAVGQEVELECPCCQVAVAD